LQLVKVIRRLDTFATGCRLIKLWFIASLLVTTTRDRHCGYHYAGYARPANNAFKINLHVFVIFRLSSDNRTAKSDQIRSKSRHAMLLFSGLAGKTTYVAALS
jgi:hypothetical protein